MRVVLLILLAIVPLALPFAALSPNLSFVRQATLRFDSDGAGVNCEARSVGLFGRTTLRRYDHIENAYNDFRPVTSTRIGPNTDNIISTLALRSRDGVHHPLESLRESPQPRSMAAPTVNAITEAAEINRYIEHPTTEPLIITRSQSYPLGFVIFDAIGLALLVIIPGFWTFPIGLAVWRRLNGAAAEEVAEPFIKLFGRIGLLATRLSNR